MRTKTTNKTDDANYKKLYMREWRRKNKEKNMLNLYNHWKRRILKEINEAGGLEAFAGH